MYNLIVFGNPSKWDEATPELDRSRVVRFGEYTEKEVAGRFEDIGRKEIEALKSFPAVFAYERGISRPARIGRITDIKCRAGRVRFSYECFEGLPVIPYEAFDEFSFELDVQDWEMNRTHWALKDVDLFVELVAVGVLDESDAQRVASPAITLRSPRRENQILVAPKVFKIPELQARDGDFVAVMMPFSEPFSDAVYGAIQDACHEASLRCLRADEVWEESAVIQDIFNLVYRSRIVVADFSTRNQNVMYETGIAHTLGRDLVPIAQSLDQVPFDLTHHRVLRYLPNGEGLDELRRLLASRLKTLVS